MSQIAVSSGGVVFVWTLFVMIVVIVAFHVPKAITA